jgi:hypothetical protein
VGTDDRQLTIRFYDVAGHTVDQAFDLELYCDEGAACDGLCLDLDTDPDHCGQCDNVCADTFEDACQVGRCVQTTSCSTERNTSCEELCASEGLGPSVEVDWGGGSVGVGREYYGTQTCYSTGGPLHSCSDRPVDPDVGILSFICACLD